ncbi:hypothetical protein HRR80_001398 [Exophiala dermatitidis]|uniref:Uncharacterized protein n=1 Tax=Exophiala dermatitidis TaxID=5970 RepID=A0AAN6IXB0_EXODE|nr:hypothetical protein HRR80_001398 [Exophiala dermatitidis]
MQPLRRIRLTMSSSPHPRGVERQPALTSTAKARSTCSLPSSLFELFASCKDIHALSNLPGPLEKQFFYTNAQHISHVPATSKSTEPTADSDGRVLDGLKLIQVF